MWVHIVTQSTSSLTVDKVGKDLRLARPSLADLRISSDQFWRALSSLTCVSALGPLYRMESISAT